MTEDNDNFEIKIPMLGADLTIFSALIDKDLMHRVELEALEVIRQMETHPSAGGFLEPCNAMEQSMSFVVQNILTEFFHVQDKIEEDNPPI